MLIWIGRQSKTHHDLQMPTYGKKTSGGTKTKSSKLQKSNRAFEDEPILNYKEHCKKHENHFISAVLFSTPLRCKTVLRAISFLLFVCLLHGYSGEWHFYFSSTDKSIALKFKCQRIHTQMSNTNREMSEIHPSLPLNITTSAQMQATA